MKSKIVQSLVLVGLSTAGLAAQAEGFNFYALLDGGIASTTISSGGGSRTEFVTGGYAPNFFGLTAEKSLGSGLSGGFKLEQGFLLTGKTKFGEYGAFGPDALFNRQANLYLKGDFGTLTAGTQGNVAFGSVLLGEPRAGSNFGSALASIDLDGGLGTVDQGAVSYVSPAYSGFTAAVAYAPETDTSKSGSRVALTYTGSALSASLAGYEGKTTAGVKSSGTVLSGAYKLGDFTLKGLAVSQKTGTYNSLDTVGLGGAYALNSSTTFDLGVYESKDNAAGYKVATIGAGVQYKLLKDLTLYGQYASAKNKGSHSAAYNFAGPSSTFLTNSITAGQTANTVNVGLLYSFF